MVSVLLHIQRRVRVVTEWARFFCRSVRVDDIEEHLSEGTGHDAHCDGAEDRGRGESDDEDEECHCSYS